MSWCKKKRSQGIWGWAPGRAGFLALSPGYLACILEFSVGGWMGEEEHKGVMKGCQEIMNKSSSVHAQESWAHGRQMLVLDYGSSIKCKQTREVGGWRGGQEEVFKYIPSHYGRTPWQRCAEDHLLWVPVDLRCYRRSRRATLSPIHPLLYSHDLSPKRPVPEPTMKVLNDFAKSFLKVHCGKVPWSGWIDQKLPSS